MQHLVRVSPSTRNAIRSPILTSLTASRAVELIRREVLRLHPEAMDINAVLIDFFLYDLAKEREGSGKFSCATLSP